MLQAIIKSDMKDAMINRDKEKLALLRVVVGEINTLSKAKDRVSPIVQDDEVIVLVKKMKENAIEMGNTDEVKILDLYLPSLMGEKQLEIIIRGLIQNQGFSGMKDMGKIMGLLKNNYPGTYDGKMASNMVKDLLG